MLLATGKSGTGKLGADTSGAGVVVVVVADESGAVGKSGAEDKSGAGKTGVGTSTSCSTSPKSVRQIGHS